MGLPGYSEAAAKTLLAMTVGNARTARKRTHHMAGPPLPRGSTFCAHSKTGDRPRFLAKTGDRPRFPVKIGVCPRFSKKVNHMAEPGMHKGDESAGKVALVTGAARNIGRAIALSLASGGAKVAVNTRSNAEQAQGVVKEIKALGTDAEAYVADIADPKAIQPMVDQVLKRFGRL